ncbi:MAG: DUF2156 domain-containing protein [wastewater metagenome]|nr:DUF2156 domain-containing protein [Candidatus Loosdrechtia aerotolerans]
MILNLRRKVEKGVNRIWRETILQPIDSNLLGVREYNVNIEEKCKCYGLYQLKIEDKEIFDMYVREEGSNLCDYSFANNFIWKGSIELLWKLIHDNFCLFGLTSKGMRMMLPPLGKNNIQDTLRECFNLMHDVNDGDGFVSYINYVYEGFLNLFDKSSYYIIEGYPDYIYNSSNLIKLSGRRYEKKRNEINFFKKHYNATYEKFSPQHKVDALLMIDRWKEEKIRETNLLNHREAHYYHGIILESEAAKCAIIFSEELGLKGAVVAINSQVEGITLGEYVAPHTASILIEKTNGDFHGMPQFIYQRFCESSFSDTLYINAGEDWGIEGLRLAKMSYRPCMLAKKFLIYDTKDNLGWQ